MDGFIQQYKSLLNVRVGQQRFWCLRWKSMSYITWHVCEWWTHKNCQCSPFSKKNPIIRNFCISEWLAVPIIPDYWSLMHY